MCEGQVCHGSRVVPHLSTRRTQRGCQLEFGWPPPVSSRTGIPPAIPLLRPSPPAARHLSPRARRSAPAGAEPSRHTAPPYTAALPTLPRARSPHSGRQPRRRLSRSVLRFSRVGSGRVFRPQHVQMHPWPSGGWRPVKAAGASTGTGTRLREARRAAPRHLPPRQTAREPGRKAACGVGARRKGEGGKVVLRALAQPSSTAGECSHNRFARLASAQAFPIGLAHKGCLVSTYTFGVKIVFTPKCMRSNRWGKKRPSGLTTLRAR